MHQYSAPAKPANFDAAVDKQRKLLEASYENGSLGSQTKAKVKAKAKAKAKAGAKKVDPFPNKWSAFKAELSRAQYMKCAFCEGRAIGQGFGDVEHYSPKGEVQSLRDQGAERADLANVDGRTTDLLSPIGYWWLAYEWDNYILACAICNQQWKRAIFPIVEGRGGSEPRRGAVETPLLLHPFRGPVPSEHLEFGSLGEVKARNGSAYGHETIRTVGLDRPSLREQRRALASKIHKKMDAMMDASVARRRELLDDIRLEGGVDQIHCGMIRSIFEQRTGMSWQELERELGP
jgi:hypothetical protein